MEEVPETKWKPANAPTLLWCCFCDAQFENPALLSKHLDRYNVNWKLYWQLFYSRRAGKACVLCNILHADRKSLECHFKMVHCIAAPSAKREPDVITIEGGPSDECLSGPSLNETGKGEVCPSTAASSNDAAVDQVCPAQSCSQSGREQDNPEIVRPENVSDIDVLFEINHTDAVECETSGVTTSESLRLALPASSTSSDSEQSPRSEDEVQMLHHSIEEPSPRLTSRTNGGDNPELVILPDDMPSAPLLTTSTAIAALQPNDEVKEFVSDGMDLLSPSKFSEEEAVSVVAQKESAIYENPDVIQIEDDVAATLVESSERAGVVPPCVDFPPGRAAAESRHPRPTAVVNPFGTREESCSTPTEGCEWNISEQLPSARLQIPGSSQTPTCQGFERGGLVPTVCSSVDSDLIAVVADDADNNSDISAPESSSDPLRDCRTPPHDLGEIEMELAEHLPNPLSGAESRDLPDLSRLTPSKIAVFMNKDIFSAKHQSDIEKHLEEKTLGKPLSSVSKESSAEAPSCEGDCETDSAESRMSRKETAPGVQKESVSLEQKSQTNADISDHSFPNNRRAMPSSLRSGEHVESLPFGFNIVNVKSLSSNPLSSDNRKNRSEKQPAKDRGNTQQPSDEIGEEPGSGIRLRRKRTLNKTTDNKTTDGDCETPAASAMDLTVEEHDVSTSRRKKSRTSQNSVGMQPTSGSSKGVFKQPIGLCVGVIHPGSLVEVSTSNVPQTARAPTSLDGMVMKVETNGASVRYFIHFPNMDKRLDRWVYKEDIIQVYRTEEESADQATSPLMTSPGAPDQTKRRLSFEPSPKAQRSKNVSVPHAESEQPDTMASVRSPPQKFQRLAAPAGEHATLGIRRPPGRRGRPIGTAMTRPPHQQAKTSGMRLKKAALFQKLVNAGGAGMSGRTDSDPSKLVPGRSKRVTRTASGAGIGRFDDFGATARPDNHVHASHHKEERPVGKKQKCSVFTRTRSAKITSNRDVQEAFKAEGSSALFSQASTDVEVQEKNDKPLAGANTLMQNVSNAGSKAPPQKGHVKPRGQHRVKTEPPHGVIIHRATDSMLDSLRPGILVYVICLVLKKGWLRLYPAEIKEVLDRERFFVHYLGYKSSHNEWIAPDLIHSILDVRKKLPPQSLRASWLVNPNEPTPADEREERAPLSATRETDRRNERTEPVSSGSKHLDIVQGTQVRDISSRRGSSPRPKQGGLLTRTSRIVPKPAHRCSLSQRQPRLTRCQYMSSSTRKEPPPILSRERPPRHNRDASVSLPEVPPSLARESRVAPATRGNTATGGRDAVNFWTSVADVRCTTVARRTRREFGSPSSSATLAASPANGYAVAPPVPLLSSSAASTAGANDSETVAPESPHLSSATGASASNTNKRRGRPPKRGLMGGRPTRPPLLASGGVHPASSSTQSSLNDVPSTAERQCERRSECLSVHPNDPVPQQPSTDMQPVGKRRPGRPVKKRSVASLTPTRVDLSPLPGFKLIGTEIPLDKDSRLVLGQSRRVQLPSSDSPWLNDHAPAPNAANRSADSDSLLSDPVDGSADKSPMSSDAEQERPLKRSLRSLAPAVTVKNTVIQRGPPPRLPPARSTPDIAAPTGDRRDCSSNESDPALTDSITPCTAKNIKNLKDGDVVYVVYEVKEEGTKFIYPAKILNVNRDLYYARFLVHYLGWAHRYDEWIAGEVIHSIVDRSRPNFNVKSLKRRVVPSPRRREQLSQVRPCSVDLSVNNICFFSALRRGRFSVDDKRILAMCTEARRQNAGWTCD